MVAASLAKRAISELFTQQVRAPTMSGSAAEAKRRSIYFFRDICRVSAFLFYSSSALLSARPEQIEGLFPFCLASDNDDTHSFLIQSSSRFHWRRDTFTPTDDYQLIPAIMLEYNLDEVTTKAALRTQLANKWRVQVGSEPQDVDMLLFKGNEELTTVMSHHYNRHHLISKYVQPESNKRDAKISSHTRSKFVNDFLAN